jgi:hypothetical protein
MTPLVHILILYDGNIKVNFCMSRVTTHFILGGTLFCCYFLLSLYS